MTVLTLVGSCPSVQRVMLHAIYTINCRPPAQRQYVMFIQPEYRFKPEEPELIVFCTRVSLEEVDVARIRKMYNEYGCEYVAVSIEGISQDDYHDWANTLIQEFPKLKFFDPAIGGKHLDIIKSETGYA